MSETLGLTALNKSSCKVATFAVRIFGGAVGSYTYKSRSNGADCTMYKFEAILIGTDASAYLRGYVKGTAAQTREASMKFGDGSCWLLSKTVLDSFTNAAFISTPVPHRVDLAKSTLTPVSLDTLPTHPVPPRTVADLAVITTNRTTDLLAVIKSVSDQRQSGKGVPIVDVTLIDGSTLPTGSTAGASQPGAAKATILVSVWGEDKVKQIQAKKGDAMAFFGLFVCANEGRKQINHYPEEALAAAPDCAKATELTRAKDELVAAAGTKMLTTEWLPNSVATEFLEMRQTGGAGQLAVPTAVLVGDPNLTAGHGRQIHQRAEGGPAIPDCQTDAESSEVATTRGDKGQEDVPPEWKQSWSYMSRQEQSTLYMNAVQGQLQDTFVQVRDRSVTASSALGGLRARHREEVLLESGQMELTMLLRGAWRWGLAQSQLENMLPEGARLDPNTKQVYTEWVHYAKTQNWIEDIHKRKRQLAGEEQMPSSKRPTPEDRGRDTGAADAAAEAPAGVDNILTRAGRALSQILRNSLCASAPCQRVRPSP